MMPPKTPTEEKIQPTQSAPQDQVRSGLASKTISLPWALSS